MSHKSGVSTFRWTMRRRPQFCIKAPLEWSCRKIRHPRGDDQTLLLEGLSKYAQRSDLQNLHSTCVMMEQGVCIIMSFSEQDYFTEIWPTWEFHVANILFSASMGVHQRLKFVIYKHIFLWKQSKLREFMEENALESLNNDLKCTILQILRDCAVKQALAYFQEVLVSEFSV